MIQHYQRLHEEVVSSYCQICQAFCLKHTKDLKLFVSTYCFWMCSHSQRGVTWRCALRSYSITTGTFLRKSQPLLIVLSLGWTEGNVALTLALFSISLVSRLADAVVGFGCVLAEGVDVAVVWVLCTLIYICTNTKHQYLIRRESLDPWTPQCCMW